MEFGARISFLQQDLSGKSSFITYWNEWKECSWEKTWAHVIHCTCSKIPTRFVLVIPVSYAEHIGIKNRKVLELARIPSGFQLTASNTLKTMEPLSCRLAEPVSVVLVLNRESMLLDPIDWSSLKADLRDWAIAHSRSIEIPEYTDNRFRERVPASYKPREV